MSSTTPQDNRDPPKRAAERSESRGRGSKKHSPEKPRHSGSDASQKSGMSGSPGSIQMGMSSSPLKGSQSGDSRSTESQASQKREPQSRIPTTGGPKPRDNKSNDAPPSIPRTVFKSPAAGTTGRVLPNASSCSEEEVLAEGNLENTSSFLIELEVDEMGWASIRKTRRGLDESEARTEPDGPRNMNTNIRHQITPRNSGSMAHPPRPVGLMALSSSVGDRHTAMTQSRASDLYSGPGIHSTFRFTASGPPWNAISSARSQLGAKSRIELPGPPLGGQYRPIYNDDPGRQPLPGPHVAQNFISDSSLWSTIDEAEENRRQQIFDQLGDVDQRQAVSSRPRAQSVSSISRANAGIGSSASQPPSPICAVPKSSVQPSSPQVKSLAPRTEAIILRDLMALGSRLTELNEHYQVRQGEKNHGLFDTIFEKFVEDAWNILTLDMVSGDSKQLVPCPKAQKLADKIIEDLPRLSNADYDDFDPIVALEFRQHVALVYKAVLEREGGMGVFKWSC